MIKNIDELRTVLDFHYFGKWSYGNPSKELDINEEWLVLTMISDNPLIADDKILEQCVSYQLAYYSTDPFSNIDEFFLDNELIYTFKQQTYISEEQGFQTVYEFFL